MKPTVLIAEDEPNIRSAMAEYLRALEYAVVEVANGREAQRLLQTTAVDVVVSDIRMPEMDGYALLRWNREDGPGIPVLLVTGHGDVGDAVAALRDGAADYMLKPFELSELGTRVGRCLRQGEVERSAAATAGQADWFVPPAGPFADALTLALQAAPTDATVLIGGESGTGKEVVARLVHRNSRRNAGPFVAVNAAAIPESLLESELFGHERGAFTGATQRRIGYFEAAHRGTLFLDEIGELPLSVQVKLLRVIQERVVQRLGNANPIPIDLRLIVATNRNLSVAVRDGRFREDLFYRIRVIEVQLPALRDRRADIPGLCAHLLPRVAQRMGRRAVPTLSAAALDALSAHPFPGNVRELENMIERALIVTPEQGTIEPHALGLSGVDRAAAHATTTSNAGAEFNLAAIERCTIERALAYCQGNRTQAAALLGIGRRTLQEKLKSYTGGQ